MIPFGHTIDALEFVLACINEMSADGFQTWEGNDGIVPDGITPDDYGYLPGERGMWLRFGDKVFQVRVSKVACRS